MKNILILIQDLLKDKVTIPKPISISVKYFNIEYPPGDDETPKCICVVVDKGIETYLNQFKNTPDKVMVVYNRALSGNLDEWLTNTIKSTWPKVKVSIESATNIQSIVAQLDSENLQNEFDNAKKFTDSLEKDRILTTEDLNTPFNI
ncbi:MAG: hypothetical protein HY973_03765 [Candidatus Kerfeldbacteria bacterium]|nr:hypothetical protein [Candidatus Kerfeldbacteria bacterium]